MPGYSQNNQAYNPNYGIDWGKMALYGAGAALGVGFMRAAGRKAAPHLKRLAAQGKPYVDRARSATMEGVEQMRVAGGGAPAVSRNTYRQARASGRYGPAPSRGMRASAAMGRATDYAADKTYSGVMGGARGIKRAGGAIGRGLRGRALGAAMGSPVARGRAGPGAISRPHSFSLEREMGEWNQRGRMPFGKMGGF